MTMKGVCLLAALTLSQVVPAQSQETWIFHPYVPLGSHCQGGEVDPRLAGIPVPLGSTVSRCDVKLDVPPARGARELILDPHSRRIVGTRDFE